jgi:flagellar biosynthesis protein FliR
MLTLSGADLVGFVQSVLWPFLRCIGLFLVAPVFGAAVVPARIKVILALLLGFLLAPLAAPAEPVEALGGHMMLLAASQILIGVAMGFAVQIVFEALSLAGQTIASTMGLGYATLLDPQRGTSVPVVSQFLLVLGVLLFLSIDGHLSVIGLLAESFRQMPVGELGFPAGAAQSLAIWGGKIFEAGLMIGLPAIVALIVVNLALGIVSRAAPSLNLFAIGFPVGLGVGFLVLILSLQNLEASFSGVLEASFEAVRALFGGAGRG